MMISNLFTRLVMLFVSAVAAGCDSREEISTSFTLAGHNYNTQQMIQYNLPSSLREISGLAMTDRGEVLAHNDEQGVIYRIDSKKGQVLGSFTLGERMVHDDFEGITTLGQQVFLVASTGILYETQLPVTYPEDNPDISIPVDYKRYEVTLPCEVEGLATLSSTTLLAVCKTLDDGNDVLRVYAWSVIEQHYLSEPYLSLDKAAFDGVVPELRKLRPSGIAVTDAGNLLIIGRHGDNAAIIEVDAAGRVIGLHTLPDSRRHPQPEGISFTRSAALLIADEGAKSDQKDRRGRLGVYQPK